MTKCEKCGNITFSLTDDGYEALGIKKECCKKTTNNIFNMIEIPTWRINEILFNEGYFAESTCAGDKHNTSEEDILTLHIGFSLAVREMRKVLQKQEDEK